MPLLKRTAAAALHACCGLAALATVAHAAVAAAPPASAPSATSGPCRAVRLPDRGPLAAERARIAKVDDELKKRNEALQLRGGTLDVTDLAAVDAYNRDVAALEADAAANDHAWDAYQDRLAKTHRSASDAARCGNLATGARARARSAPPVAASAASSPPR